MKIQVINYTFDKVAKTITFTDYASINLDSIYAVINVTRDIVVYNPTSSSLGGTVATNVLTLTYDTSSMANTDKLLILYDDRANQATLTGALTETAPGTDTASSGLNGRLQRIAQRITTLIGTILTVKTDQTTHGTTDLVAADNTKIGGTAVDVNSGNKSNGTQRVVIATDQPQLTNKLLVTPDARVRTADTISAGLATDAIMNNLTALTPKFAKIDRATNADGAAVVNLVSLKKLRVLTLTLVSAGIVSVKWQSSTSNSSGAGSNTDLTGLMSLVANTGMADVFSPVGLFETVSGEALKLNLNAAVQVSGYLTYIEV